MFHQPEILMLEGKNIALRRVLGCVRISIIVYHAGCPVAQLAKDLTKELMNPAQNEVFAACFLSHGSNLRQIE